ncbi:hypothetical protein [Candidatus Nitrospira nitrosa]|nr:hypothetical protein [Candidatus Nitrospira nitrosa]
MRIITKHFELELAHYLFISVFGLELYLGPDQGLGRLVWSRKV